MGKENLNQLDLIAKVKGDRCSESLTKLIESHSRLCFEVAKRYLPLMTSMGYSRNDFSQDTNIIIDNAAQNYSSESGCKFSSWVGNCVRYFCLNYINKHGKKKMDDSADIQAIEAKNEFSNQEQRESVDNILAELEKLPDARIAQVFLLRYFGEKEEKKWKNIAARLGVSNQTAVNIHSKGMSHLRENTEIWN